jgi:hypothetical protein
MIAYSLKEAWGNDLETTKKYSHDFLFESDEEYTQLKNYILQREPIHILIWDKVSSVLNDTKHALFIMYFIVITLAIILYFKK